MARRIKTGRAVFRERLDYLVDERGIGAVAKSRGVTTRTVQRWLQEETTPSQAQREGIRRAGLRAGAPRADQGRYRGRFTTTPEPADANVRRGVVQSRRAERNARIADAQARGDRDALRAARNMRVNLSREELNSLSFRRQMLREQTPATLDAQGIALPPGVDEGGYEIDSWTNWRADYQTASGE